MSSYEQSASQSKQVQQTIHYIRELLPVVKRPVRFVLVHNDYAFHNILLKKVANHWEVSGILDFEWSFYGDGNWDIACFYWYLINGPYQRFNQIFDVFKSAYYRNYANPIFLSLDEIKAYTLLRLLFIRANYWGVDDDDFEIVMRWQ